MTYIKFNGKNRYIPYYYLYVLKLEQGKYYVGITRNVDKRFKKHKSGDGAKYTKIYQSIKIVETLQTMTCSYKLAGVFENEKTLQYMRKYGRGNVRGGIFCAVDQKIVDEMLGPSFCAEVPLEIVTKNRKPRKNKEKKVAVNKTPAELGLQLSLVNKLTNRHLKLIRREYWNKTRSQKITVYVDYNKHIGYVKKSVYDANKSDVDKLFKMEVSEHSVAESTK